MNSHLVLDKVIPSPVGLRRRGRVLQRPGRARRQAVRSVLGPRWHMTADQEVVPGRILEAARVLNTMCITGLRTRMLAGMIVLDLVKLDALWATVAQDQRARLRDR